MDIGKILLVWLALAVIAVVWLIKSGIIEIRIEDDGSDNDDSADNNGKRNNKQG